MLSVTLKLSRPDFVIDVAFELERGITVLFGPSGSGKSSILQAIAGLLAPETARIRAGETVWTDTGQNQHLPTHQRGIAYVFQNLALFPHLTVKENVAYGLVNKMNASEHAAAVALALEKFAIGHVADRYPKTLSGGEAQRVALARAFAYEPTLVLCDEPFAALDASLRAELSATLRQTVNALQIPALHVTHDRDEARALADEVLLLDRGKIVKRGPPSEVL
jgi:molybdate transport system ATP-binding protein